MTDKFIILGDIHIGSRNASLILCEYQIKFFEEVLFPYMLKNGITTILQLGDLFDSRKFSNHTILHIWKMRVFDVMANNGIKMITLLGNHDIVSRNTLEVNAPTLFLSEYDNIDIINYPVDYNINGIDFLLLPWICMENQAVVAEKVKSTDAIFCAGHFEFDGFEMQRGIPAHGGMAIDDYKGFDCVFSGHYHTRNKRKNIQYVGTPFEQTWADYADQKGFHVFDVTTHKTTFVKNLNTLFFKCEYNDDGVDPIQPKNVKGAYVKVIVLNKTDPYKFEKFITNIISQEPADLKITEIEVDFEAVDVEDELKLEDTATMMSKFVDQCETSLNRDKLKLHLTRFYATALEICD